MSKYTKWIPEPVREKLHPYKEKLFGKNKQDGCAQATVPAAGDGVHPMTEQMRAFSQKYGRNYVPIMREQGWTKPGHMFDELGAIFQKNSKLYLLGTAEDTARLRGKLAFIGVPMEETAMQPDKLLASPELARISEKTAVGYTVIIGYQEPGKPEAVAQALLASGKHFLDVNLFYEVNFVGIADDTGDYCGIFAVYTNEKVYLKHQNILVTTVCNLNCEYCLNYNPYNKHQRHFTLEELKRSAEIYFTHIDRVSFFELTGGEPMLCPHLKDIVQFISENYRDKIDRFSVVTNGTVDPSEELLEVLKKNNVMVIVDDYSEAVPKVTKSVERLAGKLKDHGIQSDVLPKIREFLKTFPPQKSNMDLSVEQLQDKYRKCTLLFQNLRDGKLCSCTYFAFAVNAGLIPNNDSEWFDMTMMSNSSLDKKKLVEFRCGFNKKGYTEWCRYCNGLQKINNITAPAAEQVKGHLDWDIEHPTFLDE